MKSKARPATGRLLYAQSGGVTSVINASAAVVIQNARAHGIKVYAARNGILGALREELIDTSKETTAAIEALRHTPGGAFGSCRYKLKSLDANRAEYARLIDVLRAHDIRWFLYNGGNDSADTALKISQPEPRLETAFFLREVRRIVAREKTQARISAVIVSTRVGPTCSLMISVTGLNWE